MRQRSRWHQSSREREAPSHRGPSGPAACDVSFAGVLCMPCMAWSRRRGAVWQCSGSVPCGLRSAVVIRTTRSFSFQKADMKPAADSGPNDHAHRARTDTARGGRVQRAGARTQTRYTHDAPTCAPADRCMHIIHSVSCPHAPYISGSKCGMPLCKHPETEPAVAHPPLEVAAVAGQLQKHPSSWSSHRQSHRNLPRGCLS